MTVLTFTSLFPNQVDPNHGVFTFHRMRPFARKPGNTLRVVAPVPYWPSWLRFSKWQSFGRVPRQEQMAELTVYHPRYLLVPKVSMPLHGLLIFLGTYLLIRRLHRELQFDCIDAHYVYPDGFAAVLIGKLLHVPVVVSALGTDINLFPRYRTIRLLLRWTLKRVAGAISVSAALQDAMLPLGLAPKKAIPIGNGVDTERFQPVERSAARRKLGIAQDASVVVSVGSLIPLKGCQFLIPAVGKLIARHPGLRLYIVGQGPFRQELEQMVRDLGLTDRVELAGPQPNEELKYWYSAADVSCLASSREGWPNVILESMACGTPPVATRVGGTPEIIVSSELGVMVEQNVDSIADGLETALTKAWDREAIVRYARGRTWKLVAEEIEQFLARCCQQAQASGAAG